MGNEQFSGGKQSSWLTHKFPKEKEAPANSISRRRHKHGSNVLTLGANIHNELALHPLMPPIALLFPRQQREKEVSLVFLPMETRFWKSRWGLQGEQRLLQDLNVVELQRRIRVTSQGQGYLSIFYGSGI